MNTADITCDKMTERSKTSNSQHIDLNTELEVLDEVRNKCSSNWYDRVYLCWEDTDFKKPNTYGPIKGFNCYHYNSFENADRGWDKDLPEYNTMPIRHTMIPICKWVPVIFDRYILDWKLKNMYWLGKHTMGNGYNGLFKK
jgi:hypothetical protein